MDGDELKVICKYCSCVLNAKYLQLLRHSLSNKHLVNAAAVLTTISFPMAIDKATDTSVQLSQDDEMVTDAEVDTLNTLDDESADANVQHFDDDVLFTADRVVDNNQGRRKVGHTCVHVV